MFEGERNAARGALSTAAEALRNRTADSIVGLSQFFPNVPDFANALLWRIELAKGNLRSAKIERYNAGKTKNPAIYVPDSDGISFNVHQCASSFLKVGSPAFAFPPSNIYVLSKWDAPETEPLRTGILVHEVFHLEYKATGAEFQPVVGHSKTTPIFDAYAYQGFVCFVNGLEQVAPLGVYPGPYLFGESPGESLGESFPR